MEVSKTKTKFFLLGVYVDVFIFHCDNNRCVWFGTGWMVQINPDGTIPMRPSGGDKAFPELTPAQETLARDTIRKIVAEDGTPELLEAWRRREGEDELT